MSRGFAGGLAEGLNQGMQMYSLHENIKSRAKADERADAADLRDQETHAAKQQEIQSVRNMTEGWAKILGWNPQQAGGAPMRTDAPGLGAPSQPDTPSAIGLGGPAPMGATPSAAGLQSAAPAQAQQEPMSPGEYIQKQVWSGDAFSNPETLNKMAAVAFANNQGPMGIQFLNQVHTAKKQGWSDALGRLVSGDTAGATKVLKQNGMDIRGELTPVEGEEHTYEADIGGKKQKISARNLFMSGNPEEAYKMHIQSQELARKTAMEEKKHDLEVQKVANDTRKTNAEIGYLGERGKLAQANALKAARTPAKSASSEKSIEQAVSRWDKRADISSTVTGEDGTKEIDPDLRSAYDDARSHILSMIEDEDGEVDSRMHHRVIDGILSNPKIVKGTPKEKAEAQVAILRRLKLDASEEQKQEPEALPGKPAEKKAPPAAPLKAAAKDNSAERVAEAYSGTKYHDPMLSVQRAMRSPNLSPEQRANLAMRASKIAAEYEKEHGKRK
jgi:hypothetical protein